MTRDLTNLFARSYPAVLIERWSAFSGWPCYRVYLAKSPDAEPVWDGVEHEHVAQARSAARVLAAQHGDCPVLDMGEDPHG